jgi:hypothetical protein
MPRKVNIKKITIPSGKVMLHGTVFSPPCGDSELLPAILFIHGWLGNETEYVERARQFAVRDFICLTINLRGHGASEGAWDVATREEHLQDVVAAYDAMIGQPNVNADRIGVFGSSYGCYLAMLLSERRKVAWLVLRTPATYPDIGFANIPMVQVIERLGNYRRQPAAPEGNAALQSLSAFRGDVLIIAGERDEEVPSRTIENVAGACQVAHSIITEVIRGADHVLSKDAWRDQANQMADRWVARITRKKRR